MKRITAFCSLLLLFGLLNAQGAISYWFQNWQPKPDAQQAAAYLMVPGTNIVFSYANNRVIINSSGASPMPPGSAVWWTDGTNVWWTNTIPSQVQIGDGSGFHITLGTDGKAFFGSNVTVNANLSTKTLNVSGPAVFGDILYGDGSGLSNLVCTTVGLTTNFPVIFADTGITNTLYFTNGLLMAINVAVPPISSYLIQPAGAGFLLQADGVSKFLIP